MPSEMVFQKSKNTNVCVILISKWQQPEMLVSTTEIYPVQFMLWPQYILADIFHKAATCPS